MNSAAVLNFPMPVTAAVFNTLVRLFLVFLVLFFFAFVLLVRLIIEMICVRPRYQRIEGWARIVLVVSSLDTTSARMTLAMELNAVAYLDLRKWWRLRFLTTPNENFGKRNSER